MEVCEKEWSRPLSATRSTETEEKSKRIFGMDREKLSFWIMEREFKIQQDMLHLNCINTV